MESQEQRLLNQAIIERLDMIVQLQAENNKMMEILAGDVLEELQEMEEDESEDSEQDMEDLEEEKEQNIEEMKIKPSMELNKEE